MEKRSNCRGMWCIVRLAWRRSSMEVLKPSPQAHSIWAQWWDARSCWVTSVTEPEKPAQMEQTACQCRGMPAGSSRGT
eukprot:12255355-Heterocapsa_arctica.AAC.1